MQQWNVTVEREPGLQSGLRVSYDGSDGLTLGVTANPDRVRANTAGFTTATKSAPYPLPGQIGNLTNAARSNYNALTVTATKRMSKGLQFQMSYNHAKNFSNGGGYAPSGFASEGGGALTDPSNPNLDYGNVAFTRRAGFDAQRFHIWNHYDLQLAKGAGPRQLQLTGRITF